MENNVKFGLRREGSPYNDQECEEIISKLEQLLDGELDNERKKDVVEMVNNCQYCLEQYKIETSLRQLIKTGVQNMVVSNSLVNGILNKIKSVRNSFGQSDNDSVKPV